MAAIRNDHMIRTGLVRWRDGQYPDSFDSCQDLVKYRAAGQAVSLHYPRATSTGKATFIGVPL
jgi:hypothetical protein